MTTWLDILIAAGTMTAAWAVIVAAMVTLGEMKARGRR
jgi:hypothetical protein